MKWAIYTFLAIQFISLGISLGITLADHGKERRTSFWGALIGVAINLFLLYECGLFENL